MISPNPEIYHLLIKWCNIHSCNLINWLFEWVSWLQQSHYFPKKNNEFSLINLWIFRKYLSFSNIFQHFHGILFQNKHNFCWTKSLCIEKYFSTTYMKTVFSDETFKSWDTNWKFTNKFLLPKRILANLPK